MAGRAEDSFALLNLPHAYSDAVDQAHLAIPLDIPLDH